MLGIDGQNPLEEMGHAGIDHSYFLRPRFRYRYRDRMPAEGRSVRQIWLAVKSSENL